MFALHALHKIMIDHAYPRPVTVKPGDFLELEPDIYGMQVDRNSEELDKIEAQLAELGVKELPLKDKMFAFLDHAAPAPMGAHAAGQKRWREFFKRHGVPTQDAGSGISSIIMPEQGLVGPGTVVAVRDSHTPTMGAVGCFAASSGAAKLSLLAIGRYWMDVPKVVLIKIKGRMPKGVFARDVALHINGLVGPRGALGRAVEFAGSFVDEMGMDMRFTLCNMGTELGAMASYIQPDDVTLAWVKGRGKKPFTVLETDAGYEYDKVHEFDISQLEPQVAVPHATHNVKPLKVVEGQHIDQAYLGSCASGRLEDIAAAASVLKGHKVHPDVRMIVTPGSREVLIKATQLGYIEALHEANAIVTSASCGACMGVGGGILAPGDVAISCNTRNHEGRMGANAQIFLASPAAVAASAIEGRITSPLKYL